MTGEDSNLYALVYGDPTNGSSANGVFKVISVSGNFSAGDYYLDVANNPWNPTAGVANTVILQPVDDRGIRLAQIADGLDLRVEFEARGLLSWMIQLRLQLRVLIKQVTRSIPKTSFS